MRIGVSFLKKSFFLEGVGLVAERPKWYEITPIDYIEFYNYMAVNHLLLG